MKIKIWGEQRDLDLLLINAPLSDYAQPHAEWTVFWPPMGLAYLASFLDRKGFRVGVWDAEIDKVSPEGVARGVKQLSPRWVGFNTFTPALSTLRSILAEIRTLSSTVGITLGGIHATVRTEDLLNIVGIKDVVVVRNDGEKKVEAILGGRSPENIPGVGVRNREGGIIINKEEREWFVDINLPEYQLNRKFVPYDPTEGHLSPDGKRRAFISSSRGCPYPCTFCASSHLAREGVPVRFRDTESVVKEVIDIIHKGVTDVKFNDDLVFASERRIRALLEPLVEAGYGEASGLELRGNSRGDVIARLSEETLNLMVEAGIKRISWGG